MQRPWAGFLVAALLALALGPGPVLAQSQGSFGISPGRLAIEQAQAGETYLHSVLVQNELDTPSTITVTSAGPSGAWARTQPPSGFTIGAHSTQQVQLTIAVPDGTGPGPRIGWVNFTTEPKGDGSGTNSVRFAAALALNVTVGGDPVEKLTWISARVEDAQHGDSVHAFVRVRNDGNVRTLAEAAGQVLPFSEGDPVLSSSTGSAEVVPGDEVEVAVTFPSGLAPGQYRARLTADGFAEVHEFKVFPAGVRVPSAELRSLVSEGELRAGRVGTILARFANTGDVDIAAATFHGELRDDGGHLVATLASSSKAVGAGTNATLEIAWTPAEPGIYSLVGQVTYDGYETLPNEAHLEVHGGAGTGAAGFPWWILVVVAIIALALVAWGVWRRSRDRDQDRRPPTRR